MMKFLVKLNVDALDHKTWDAWCEGSGAEGIEMHAVQPDGFEHWTVTAPSKAAAQEMVENTLRISIGGPDVEIVSITDKNVEDPWAFIESVSGVRPS